MTTPVHIDGPCPRCVARGKPWEGQDPKCAFRDGVFSADNWNCATMNVLRFLTDGCACYSEGQGAAVLTDGDGNHLVLRWYKERGTTEQAWWLVDDEPPSRVTLTDAEAVISWENRR